LYRDVNINQGRGIQTTQEFEDLHVTLTLVNPDSQHQSSSVSSQFVTSMLNPTPDAGMESIFETTSQMDVQTPTTVPLFLFKVAVQIQSDRLFDEAQKENDEFLKTIDENMQKIIKEQMSTSESATAEEPMQTTFEMEEPSHPEFEIDRDWNKTLSATHESIQPWISELAKQSDSRSSFNELMDTPVDFSNFLMNRLKVETLTPELLAGPTYELMKGSCKSLVELEFFLEEVYKATTNQIDWVNPKDQQYPHNLLKPLPLIPNNQVRRVIPFDHFINNDLEYLRGVRRDDDKLYKFKEGDFKRLRIQDIEDMLLLLVQGKLTNLTVEERFAFIVSLRMFTRSIVIQRRVEDLQLGVKSYQKKLNLTKPDTYRFDLKLKEAYIAYSNPRGFIYQNKDKQNRLMWIDELHKFSDGTPTDIRTALDDRLKGI
nr:hypothetical protein [Tanacetum cinerariifolium]